MSPDPTLTATLPATAPAVQSNASSTLTVIGIDMVPFSIVLPALTATATFPNLPYRNNTQNPLSTDISAAQQPLNVNPIDQLIFVVFVQALTAPPGTVVGVAPQAIDQNNIRCPGPFLGSNVFVTFQAVVTTAASAQGGTISGTIVGLLLLSSG